MTPPTHYLVKGPVLSWKLACTGQLLPAGPRTWRQGKKAALLQFPAHTKDAGQVTCSKCISTMAATVVQALVGLKCECGAPGNYPHTCMRDDAAIICRCCDDCVSECELNA